MYYLTTYGTSKVSRYDTHKKSELRNTYNRIIKLNKDSPLYKLSAKSDVKKFAIDIKESARNIQNTIASLSDGSDDPRGSFEKKIAVSSQENVVTAEYVGTGDKDSTADDFHLLIQQLAKPQVNQGNFLSDSATPLVPGSYSFNLHTTSGSYEFQFNVTASDNNLSLLDKIAKLVNHSNIGLNADIVKKDSSFHALQITSEQTGLAENENYLFSIYPDQSEASKSVIDLLGIDHVSQDAGNSSFLLNGEEHTSYSNTFTVNNQFELTLKSISADDTPAIIGFKADADAVADNVQKLVHSYNSILDVAKEYSSSQQNSQKLYTDIQSASARCKTALTSIGLTSDDDGYLTVNRDVLTEAVSSPDAESCFSTLNKFKSTLQDKANAASLNPMSYVDKILISYKNSNNKNFVNPYVIGLYSGLLLDRYC